MVNWRVTMELPSDVIKPGGLLLVSRKFIDSCGSCRVGMGYLQGVTPSLPRTLGTLRWGRDLQSNLTTMAGGTWCHSLRASLAGSTSGRLRVTRQIASSQAQSIRLGMDCHLSCLFWGGMTLHTNPQPSQLWCEQKGISQGFDTQPGEEDYGKRVDMHELFVTYLYLFGPP